MDTTFIGGFTQTWPGATPTCSCGRHWCKHIMQAIRDGVDRVHAVVRVSAKSVVQVPLRADATSIAKVTLDTDQDGLVHVCLLVDNGHGQFDSEPCGFISLDALNRLALRALIIPSLAEWLIANPCKCRIPLFDSALDALSEPAASDDAIRSATFALATLAAERLMRDDPSKCAECDESDLVPDIVPTKPPYLRKP